MDLFDESIAEISWNEKRWVLRCNPAVRGKERHRREDKLQRLVQRVVTRNVQATQSGRVKPETGLKQLKQWATRHKISSFVELVLNGREVTLVIDEQAKQEAALLDGCYCLESDVPAGKMSGQEIHDSYMDLQQVERNFRLMKTAFLEVRPIFVRKDHRTRGHVFIAMLALKVLRLMEQRLHAHFGTTENNIEAETADSSLTALGRLCLQHYQIGDQDIIGLPRPDVRQSQILAALKVNLVAP